MLDGPKIQVSALVFDFGGGKHSSEVRRPPICPARCASCHPDQFFSPVHCTPHILYYLVYIAVGVDASPRISCSHSRRSFLLKPSPQFTSQTKRLGKPRVFPNKYFSRRNDRPRSHLPPLLCSPPPHLLFDILQRRQLCNSTSNPGK